MSSIMRNELQTEFIEELFSLLCILPIMSIEQQIAQLINKEKLNLIERLASEYNFNSKMAFDKFVLNKSQHSDMIVHKELVISTPPSTPSSNIEDNISINNQDQENVLYDKEQPQETIQETHQVPVKENVQEIVQETDQESRENSSDQQSISSDKKEKKKVKFVLPWSGIADDDCCQGLKNNYGIFTQCTNPKVTDCRFCKQCVLAIAKNGDEHPCGTVVERLAVGINDYKDPKGKKVVHYTQYMKKMNITQQDVIDFADGKYIHPSHFVSSNSKRGRPSKKTNIHNDDDDHKKKPGRPSKITTHEPTPTDIVNQLLHNKLHTTHNSDNILISNSITPLQIIIPTSPTHT